MDYRVFGCKTNKYFTEKWLAVPGFSDKPGIFVASCVVTAEAKRKWLKFVRRAVSELPSGGKIYLSGCGSIKGGEVSSQFYDDYPELVPYRDSIELLPEAPSQTSDAPAVRTEGKRLTYARQYLVIQTGCDNLCTFCLTVTARGRHKSRPESEIVNEIRAFADAGGKETVLTGTNLAAWGCGDSNRVEESRIVDLIERILSETDIPRLRLSSLGPEFLSDRFLALLPNPRMHAYVHLSVQSGADGILKRMRRKYGREFLIDRIAAIRSARREDGIPTNVGADLIVGFPGETDADFEETLSLVERFGITQVHAFPFSPHEGAHAVPASKLPDQIPEPVKAERMRRLLSAGQEALRGFSKACDGLEFDMVVEAGSAEAKFSGWSQNHLALSNENFFPHPGQEWKRGKTVSGTYRFKEPS